MKKEIKFSGDNIIVEVIIEENGKFSCYIPYYDCYFGASNEEMIENKARVMVTLKLNSIK